MTARSLASRIAVALTSVGMVAGNLVIEAVRLGGRTTADVSAAYPTLVTPAGWVFAIWGLIYLGMLAYSVAQFVGPLRGDPLPDELAPALIVSNVANVAWLVAWHFGLLPLSVLIMLVLLGSLIAAYVTARRDRPAHPSELEEWTVLRMLSLYLGWISVATIANVAALLYGLGWRGQPLPQDAWAVILLVVGAVLAGLALARRRDLVYAAVFVWAYAGVGAAHLAHGVVAGVAWGLALGIAMAAVYVGVMSRRRPRAV